VLAHQTADRETGRHGSAGRMEIDWQLAAAEPAEQRAQAPVGARVDGALGRDPFPAAGTAGIRVALGEEERDRRRQLYRRCECGVRASRLRRRPIMAGAGRIRRMPSRA
jgi:hypothetical protein